MSENMVTNEGDVVHRKDNDLPYIVKGRYLANPNLCPYCESEDISGELFESTDNQTWRRVTCDSCGKMWQEIFTLTDIEEIKE